MEQLPSPHTGWNTADCAPGGRPPAESFRAAAGRAAAGRAAAGRPDRWPDCRTVLTRAFADEVIPRLLTARRGAASCPGAVPPDADRVGRLLRLVLDGTQREAVAYVAGLRADGLPTEAILLDLLTPVARRLGQMWEEDTCSFADVTLGLGRLTQAMRMLDQGSGRMLPLPSGPSALLVQAPDEQHGLGLAMVAHFFRQGGWRVREAPRVTSEELVVLVREEWFGIVGVSLGNSGGLDALARDIRAIRAQSRNRGIGVMVGGPAFLAHPQLAGLVGADATATDGRQALREAHRLLGLRACAA